MYEMDPLAAYEADFSGPLPPDIEAVKIIHNIIHNAGEYERQCLKLIDIQTRHDAELRDTDTFWKAYLEMTRETEEYPTGRLRDNIPFRMRVYSEEGTDNTGRRYSTSGIEFVQDTFENRHTIYLTKVPVVDTREKDSFDSEVRIFNSSDAENITKLVAELEGVRDRRELRLNHDLTEILSPPQTENVW